MNSSGVGTVGVWVGCVMAATLTAVGSAAPTSWPLSRLTVPEPALPSDCRLRPPAPAVSKAPNGAAPVVTVNSGVVGPFPGNPWVGTDARLLRALLGTDATALPDGPPPTLRQVRAMQSESVQHVREGYRAIYRSIGGAIVEVDGMRFDDPAHVPPAPPTIAVPRGPGQAGVDHFAIGTVSVEVIATPETVCSRTIDTYLRSLK